jgi:DNA-binding CsgD family transcriptional regulator/tetratricopeptide (TPR) repeat protein
VEVHHLLIEWSRQVGARAADAFKGRGPGPWGRRLAMEADNLRVALSALESEGETESLLALLTSLEPLWMALDYEREGYAWLTRALRRMGDPSSVLRIRAMTLASQLANAIGDVEAAIAFGQEGLAAAEQAGDSKGLADAHCTLGNIARGVGEDSLARTHYEKALDRYRALDERYSVGYVLIQLGKPGNLGTIDQPGDPQDQELAESRCQEALAIFEALGNTGGIARAHHQLGHLAYKRRDYTRAARFARKALELRWADRNMTEVATSFEDLADICGMLLGQARTAARFYGVAESLRETLGVPMWSSYRPEHDRLLDHARNALPPDRFESAWATGRSLPIADAVAEALTIAKTIATSRARQRETATMPLKINDILTVREIEVMRLVAGGHSNREIAEILFIGVPTVKSHIKKVMDKLQLDSRAAIVAYVHRHGLALKSACFQIPPS